MRRLLSGTAVSLAVLVATACSGPATGAPPAGATSPVPASSPAAAPPGDAWETAEPAELGLDAAKLEELATAAEAGPSNCLVVVRHGKLAGEWYFRGTGPDSVQEVFSITKSVTSTLVGIAQDDGDLELADSASEWIPEWAGTPAQAVTVRNLVSNDSGRQWSLQVDGQMIRSTDQTAFGIALSQEHPPGEVWAYNNSAVQTLEQVLERSTGQDVAAFAKERLFGPLGMADTRMTTDGAGNTYTYSGVRSTCRDLARFGYLILHEGLWGTKQVVSSDWVAAATGKPSTELNAAYGYLWWLNYEGIVGDVLGTTDLSQAQDPTATRGQLVPGAPDEMFWAQGLGNQIVQVDEASDTVVVRLGTLESTPQAPTFGAAETSRVVTEAVVAD